MTSERTVHHLHHRLQTLAPTHLEIIDDSARHAGHAGARDGGHFIVHITAAVFQGKSTLARHRLVYDAVGDLALNGIHALAIDARTPQNI